MAGLRRTIAKYNQMMGIRTKTGKDAMSFRCYMLLCRIFAEETHTPKYVFAHAYIVVTWNLMCRVESTENIHLKHVIACDDHL